MPLYVDGYVVPIPRKKIATYRRLAEKAAKIWREHGALEYRECIGEDLNVKGVLTSRVGSRASQAKPWCSRTSPTNRARTEIGSTPR